MISYIKGELVELTENAIVLDHDGMGFLIMMPASILAKLPAIGSELKVHTYLYVKEDALDLYGFLTKDDLKVFRLLITVSGIGPKGALDIPGAEAVPCRRLKPLAKPNEHGDEDP